MPYNVKNYHKDWKDIIRPDILKRANYKCENCKVPNHIHIIRGEGNSWIEADEFDLRLAKNGEIKVTYIVLTISHTNHNINDNDYSNLKALCQRCHLNWDREYHKLNRLINKQKLNK